MNNRGIKYYSSDDLSCDYYLEMASKVIEEFTEDEEYWEINKIIEFYNIHCYFKNEIYLLKWKEDEKERYKTIVKKFMKIIGKYFSQIDGNKMINILSAVNIDYLDDFWKLFDKFKVYKSVSGEKMAAVMLHAQFRLNDILVYKNLVECYKEELRKYLLAHDNSAELILMQYVELREYRRQQYYFPTSLNENDKETILLNYINSMSVNINYLRLIYESQNDSEMKISDKTKLKARRKHDEKVEDLFSNSVGVSYGSQVTFSNKQIEEKKINFVDHEIHASYSTLWIKENLDYPTLLNNFIYLFEFTDMQFRFQHVNKFIYMGIFEKLMGVKGKKEYLTGTAFNQLKGLAILQMISYYEELKRNNVQLESVIKWFFEEYLKNEFDVDGFYISLPSEKSTYLEKCRMIISELDSILKQFRMFVDDKEIDHELLQLSSEHMFLKDVPSLLEQKYIYPIGKEYEKVSHCLFSDQSMLHYLAKLDTQYNAFYKLLQNEYVRVEEFECYQVSEIDWLIDLGYIYVDKQGFLKCNIRKVKIVKELYDNEVLCRYYTRQYDDIIGELDERGVISYGTSLLSIPEQNYLNYLLNKSEYSNGMDLRNKYVHGTQATDEKVHEQDYFTLLRILILFIIKINEEFCLVDKK
ncbi:hypothetical protein LXJ15735_14880 [Lacrimispora xylanolytica]